MQLGEFFFIHFSKDFQMKLLKHARAAFAVTALASASLTSFAQTTTTAPMGTMQTPAAVGVSPQTAAEAANQAVPRSDTATVIRTGPNAVDASRTAASAAQGSASVTAQGGMTGNATTMRPAKADRN